MPAVLFVVRGVAPVGEGRQPFGRCFDPVVHLAVKAGALNQLWRLLDCLLRLHLCLHFPPLLLRGLGCLALLRSHHRLATIFALRDLHIVKVNQ